MFAKVGRFTQNYKLITCLYSTQNVTKKSIKYTNTINLPKTNFPSHLNVTRREELEKFLVQKCFSNLYGYQRDHNTDPEFVLHDGPPYANGKLHMGHVINKVLKDITIKHHIINKTKVHYKAGWDCHGLPIELKAMGGSSNLEPLEIRDKSQKFASNTIQNQLSEFQSWGITADWNNPKNIYKTFNPDYIQNQLKMFLSLYEKKLVYRDLKPVYWSPSSKTALAEAELEYNQNFVSPSIILRLKLSKTPDEFKVLVQNNAEIYALIWTTTPWTLPSNQAVCFNPTFEYSLIKFNDSSDLYLIATALIESFEKLVEKTSETVFKLNGERLVECTYFHPINKTCQEPFLCGNHVQASKGTGLVHTAPAHGPEDFLISLENKIKIKCFVNEEGKFNEDAPEFLKSKYVLDEGNKEILNLLKNDLLYNGKITHSYPIDWRTKKPVIFRASQQWFINTDELKSKAIEEIGKISIHPKIHSEASKRTLIAQLEKRPYWCISRQRSWGVPIPVFYEKSTNRIITNEDVIDQICSLLKQDGNINFWWSKNISEILPKNLLKKFNLNTDQIEKGQDIFDIWFDSGISWSYVLENEKIADLYLEGFDQFTGWFQSSLLTSIAHRECSPYKAIFVHGFAMDEKGHKMSKSLGNIIHPKDVIKKYGIDVMRWWVASHGTQHTSIAVSDNLLLNSSESLKKIRATLKYLNGVIEQKDNKDIEIQDLSFLDKFILNELYDFEKGVQKLYNSYEYNRVTAVIQNFIANQLSGFYLHVIKDRLYCGTNKEFRITQATVEQCYLVLCKILWPIIPFLIEESWSYYNATNPFYKTKVQTSEKWINSNIKELFNIVFEFRDNLNQKIKDENKWSLDLHIKCGAEKLNALKLLHPKLEEKLETTELCEILQVSSITLSNDENAFDITITKISNSLCPRCRRFSIAENENICKRCDDVLRMKNVFS